MPSRLLFSVIICTHNRSRVLSLAIQSLVNQGFPKNRYEVLIVDNNSNDNTGSVVARFVEDYSNIRCCKETNQGLSFARNRGWEEARGDYVGFFDDDAQAPPGWLEIAAEIAELRKPHLFGGPYHPYYLDPRPHWFLDRYGSYTLGDVARNLKVGEHLVGSNIFIRRNLQSHLGGFDTSRGMKGKRLGYGAETAVVAKARHVVSNIVIYYDPRLYIYHLVHIKKMNLTWPVIRGWKSGRAMFHIRKAESGDEPFSTPYLMLRYLVLVWAHVLHFTLGMIWHDPKKYPKWQNFVYERLRGKCYHVGQLTEQLLYRLFAGRGTPHRITKKH
jgi:glycosyltransferase involved in cell wall biosynthesis